MIAHPSMDGGDSSHAPSRYNGSVHISGNATAHLGDDIYSHNGWHHRTEDRSSHRYDNTNISGQATAIFGNSYGEIVNVFNDFSPKTFILHSPDAEACLDWVVRQNRVLYDHTLETVSKYQSSGSTDNGGLASQAQYRWYRREGIGGGLYAEVHREERVDGTGRSISRAVKVLRRTFLRKLGIDYKKELNALIQLSQPQYQHMFVHFFGWYEHYNNIHIAMEYAPLGDLSAHIDAGLAEKVSKDVIYQILNGLCTMHRLDFVHRDIKPAESEYTCTHMPATYGSRTYLYLSAQPKVMRRRDGILHTNVGTEGYKAPEIIGFVAAENDFYYDAKCDIWSLGCLFLEIITASSPFRRPSALRSYCSAPISSLREILSRANISISTGAFFLMTRLLAPIPRNRPDAEQAFEDVSEWVSIHFDTTQGYSAVFENLDSAPWPALSAAENDADDLTGGNDDVSAKTGGDLKKKDSIRDTVEPQDGKILRDRSRKSVEGLKKLSAHPAPALSDISSLSSMPPKDDAWPDTEAGPVATSLSHASISHRTSLGDTGGQNERVLDRRGVGLNIPLPTDSDAGSVTGSMADYAGSPLLSVHVKVDERGRAVAMKPLTKEEAAEARAASKKEGGRKNSLYSSDSELEYRRLLREKRRGGRGAGPEPDRSPLADHAESKAVVDNGSDGGGDGNESSEFEIYHNHLSKSPRRRLEREELRKAALIRFQEDHSGDDEGKADDDFTYSTPILPKRISSP